MMASRLQPMPTPGSHGATRGTRCHHSWLHQGCVCWGGGAGPSPVVARGWAGRGDRGGRRVTPRRWVGDQGLGAPSSAMRVRSRGLLAGTWPGLDGSRGTGGGDSQMGTSDPRLWPGAEGTPRGADQGGGRFGLGREEGWTHLPLRTWGPAPYPAPGVLLDWVVSGLSPMCLGPPALTRLTQGWTRRGRLGALAVALWGL